MTLKGKSLRRACLTNDSFRISGDVPLIQDTTEFITPEKAQEMLKLNKNNRPVNFNKVEEYKKKMQAGEWKFHAQGIVLDGRGNILTGQKRLWAIVYSGIGQYMRVSRGSPAETAPLLDRGTPQSARDVASRKTERKHSPSEASVIRAMYAIQGNVRPSLDEIADGLQANDIFLGIAMEKTKRIKKTKPVMMILAALCASRGNGERLLGQVEPLAEELTTALLPIKIQDCWNRGAAFTLAMEKAVDICSRSMRKHG